MSEQNTPVLSQSPSDDYYVAELEWNLTNHTPSEEAIRKIESLRMEAKMLGRLIIKHCPHSRERSLAVTNLEQTVMWAVAAIAREKS